MKKFLSLFTAVMLTALLLTACGGKKSADVSVDIKALHDELAVTITSGDIAEASASIVETTYFLNKDKVEESIASLNSGAGACEVAVVKCKDSDYTKEVVDLFKNRVKSQSTLFASYNAEEVTKLDAAVIASAGNYAVLCVTDDAEAAKQIIKKAGF
ncbi:MAG: DUF4358 domain-containing protein [Eubacteriales bacterium]|nr:DUF4358 domain-containing protein [Eubacteriales bacterium]